MRGLAFELYPWSQAAHGELNNACTCGIKLIEQYVYQKRYASLLHCREPKLTSSGNNMENPTHDPPTYNKRYGFADGAQQDLFPSGDVALAASNSAVPSASAPAASSSPSVSSSNRNKSLNRLSAQKKICKRRKGRGVRRLSE